MTDGTPGGGRADWRSALAFGAPRMQPIYDWFRDFYERTGINLNFIYDDFDRARMVKGFFLTLELAVVTIILSILVGIAGAWLQGSKLVWIRRIVAGFISFFRNTPPLVQIYFFYFGLGYLLPRVPDGTGALIPMISNVQWAIISLSLFAGAFNIEIFRSGIEAIPKATVEAATSFGLSRWQIYRLVVLPMAIRVCLPALGNNLVNLVKTTNLAYAIAVPELLYVSKQIWSDATNVREMMIFVLFAYLFLVFVLVGVLNVIERRLAIPGFGQDRGKDMPRYGDVVVPVAALAATRREGDAARGRAHRHSVRPHRRRRRDDGARPAAGRGQGVLARGADALGAAAAVGLCLQHPDLDPGDGRRHGGRTAGGHRPAVAVRDRARVRAHRHAALPQLAVAGAPVPVHVPDPVRDPRLRAAHPLPRLGQGHPGLCPARHGQHLRDRARRPYCRCPPGNGTAPRRSG